MVFCGFRTVSRLAGQCVVIFIRIVSVLWSKSDFGCSRVFQGSKEQENPAVFTVFTSGRDRKNLELSASFTVEAAMVMGVLLMSVAMLIQYAYAEHDKAIGAMILEETLIRAGRDQEGEYSDSYFEDIGEKMGETRLWFEEYEIEISKGPTKITGKASAGDWNKEIKMDLFRPGTFLRQKENFQGIMNDGDKNDDGAYRVQEGDESELYGDPFRDRSE